MYHSEFLVGSNIFPRMRDSSAKRTPHEPRSRPPSAPARTHSRCKACNTVDSRPSTSTRQQRPGSAVSITERRQVGNPEPSSRTKSTLPPRPVSRSTPPRPHTVATTRPRVLSAPKKWHYGKPPPEEAHAAVIDWSKAKQIRAPILYRRERVSSSCKKENAEHTQVSVLQPYPMNYNAFLVQSLHQDMRSLYSPSPDMIIRPSSSKSAQESSDEDEGHDDDNDNISVGTYWKMT